MSSRPIRRKQANRLRKAMRRKLPQFVDPRDWMVLRGFARSRRHATELIFAGKLRSESHTLGFIEVERLDGEKIKVLQHVPFENMQRATVIK